MTVFFLSHIALQQYKTQKRFLPTPQPLVSLAAEAWRLDGTMRK
ncbi:hypothetical protein QTA58_01925 [Neorhizobium sp. CSC1952]|nr:hypothetical protein [Rhizobium sp. CSC1952]WJR67549.1 hypothetical protein QTA58_01925 [Rhizobium sp. CSC1952]